MLSRYAIWLYQFVVLVVVAVIMVPLLSHLQKYAQCIFNSTIFAEQRETRFPPVPLFLLQVVSPLC